MIQGTVADALNVALANLRLLRNQMGLKTRFCLPIHDAILFDVPIAEHEVVTQVLIPTCMTEMCEIPHLGLKIPTEIDTMFRWNEKVKSLDEAIEQSLKAKAEGEKR